MRAQLARAAEHAGLDLADLVREHEAAIERARAESAHAPEVLPPLPSAPAYGYAPSGPRTTDAQLAAVLATAARAVAGGAVDAAAAEAPAATRAAAPAPAVPTAPAPAAPADAARSRSEHASVKYRLLDVERARAARRLLRLSPAERSKRSGKPQRRSAGDVDPVQADERARHERAADSGEASRMQAAAAKPKRDDVPMWQVLSRRERRIAAQVFQADEERQYRFEWMTPDDLSRSDDELEKLDEHRRKLLASARRKDGSRLARLESVFSPYEKHTVRLIRDDAMFAATEWGKLWRADRMLAGLALEACLGMREDGTACRSWHSQRARSTLAIVWMFYKVGSTRGADLGELRVRGVSMQFLCTILATGDKDTLHRNTLGGTHVAGSWRNEEVGYLVALENARLLGRMQYGDRRNDPRVQEYHLRVTTLDERMHASLDQDEQRLREWIARRWERFAKLDALRVLSSARHRRWVEESQRERLEAIRAAVSDELCEGATDPPS